jgi:hypothetical protein
MPVCTNIRDFMAALESYGENNEDKPRITRIARLKGCTLSDEPQIRIRAIRVIRGLSPFSFREW